MASLELKRMANRTQFGEAATSKSIPPALGAAPIPVGRRRGIASADDMAKLLEIA